MEQVIVLNGVYKMGATETDFTEQQVTAGTAYIGVSETDSTGALRHHQMAFEVPSKPNYAY